MHQTRSPFFFLLLSAWGHAFAFEPAERPFLWMNQREVGAAREHLKEPWAAVAHQASLGFTRGRVPHYGDFFDILVHGNEKAIEAQKRLLLAFPSVDVTQTQPRENRVLDAIRYDILYDRLSPEERQAVEDAFRRWIRYHLHEYWRGRESIVMGEGKAPEDTRYTRVNWLPNMQHPRALGIFLMAVSLQDEALIRECFESPVAGFKWWMDAYLADGQFYMEEFTKMGPTLGEFLLWCRGVERLGLDELGFGYVGQGGDRPGGSMRRYLESWLQIGLPAPPAPEGAMPTFPAVYMGDAGSVDMIRGYPVGATAPNARWHSANMLGPAPRMRPQLWFEIAHARWPDAGFDWVLAQKRMPRHDKYYPSLFFGLDPVDPAATAPFPVASYVAPERGFGMLRMEESGAYWTSPRPAATLQFGMRYVHYVHDGFTLMHYIADRQPVFGRRALGPHQGYAGDHPWTDSARGHNGVVVDSLQIQPVDDGRNGAENTGIRHLFADSSKFLAIHAAPREIRDEKTGGSRTVALYPDVAAERLLCLTDHYLLDVFHLLSDRERVYHWSVHPHGVPRDGEDGAWKLSDDLRGGVLFTHMPTIQQRHGERLARGEFDLPNVRKRDVGDGAWELSVARGDNEPGVILRMLGGESTRLYRDVGDGVTTVIAERRESSTAFVALYEPTRGPTRISAFERIAQTDGGVALRVRGMEGEGVDDRILLAYAGSAERELTLADGRESFAFRGFAFVRVEGEEVIVHGNLNHMRLPVAATVTRILVNGQASPAVVREGVLIYK